MRAFLYYIALIICFCLTRCADPLEKILLGRTEIVTVCFISPQDTVLRANVNWANPFNPDLGNSFVRVDTVNQIKNATVILYSDDSSIELEFNGDPEARSRYGYTVSANQFPIEAGKTYTLEVSLPSGERSVASCTIPEQQVVDDIHLDYRRVGETISGPLYSYRVQWRDLNGAGNYYRTYAYLSQHFPQGTQVLPLGETGLTVQLDKNLFNDYLGDTRTCQSIGEFEDPGMPSIAPIKLNTQILHVDRHYYEYHRSIEDQAKTGNNPFYEPVLLYTNFEGGIGVFSGFNMTGISVPFD